MKNPMDQHDRNDGQQVHRHSRKISNKGKSPTDWMGGDFCQTNVQACREIRGNITSPRAHTLHAVEDKHKYKRHYRMRHGNDGRNDVGANAEGSGMHM